MFVHYWFILSVWSLSPHDFVGCLGGYGAVLHIHSFFDNFTYWSCLEQLKCNKVSSSDRLGTLNAVVWGLISLLIYFQLQIPLVPKNSFRSVGCLKRVAASSRRSSGFSTMIKVALLRKMSSSKDFVNYLEDLKKITTSSIPELSVNVNTIYAKCWKNL